MNFPGYYITWIHPGLPNSIYRDWKMWPSTLAGRFIYVYLHKLLYVALCFQLYLICLVYRNSSLIIWFIYFYEIEFVLCNLYLFHWIQYDFFFMNCKSNFSMSLINLIVSVFLHTNVFRTLIFDYFKSRFDFEVLN